MTWVDFDAPTPEAEKLIAAAKPMNAAAGTEPKSAMSDGIWMRQQCLPASKAFWV